MRCLKLGALLVDDLLCGRHVALSCFDLVFGFGNLPVRLSELLLCLSDRSGGACYVAIFGVKVGICGINALLLLSDEGLCCLYGIGFRCRCAALLLKVRLCGGEFFAGLGEV